MVLGKANLSTWVLDTMPSCVLSDFTRDVVMHYHVSPPLLDCFHHHKNILQYPPLKKLFSWPFISCHFLKRIVQIPTVLCLTILSILSLLQIIGNTSIVIANDLHIARSYDQFSDHILFSAVFGMVDHFLLLKTLSPLSLGHHTFWCFSPLTGHYSFTSSVGVSSPSGQCWRGPGSVFGPFFCFLLLP